MTPRADGRRRLSWRGEHGLDFLPGAEFSCRYTYRDEQGRKRTKSVHLLAYGYDPQSSELARRVEKIRRSRAGRARRIVELLSVDYPLTWEHVQEQTGEENASVGRPHIADALIAAGIVASREEAFGRILYAGSPLLCAAREHGPAGSDSAGARGGRCAGGGASDE